MLRPRRLLCLYNLKKKKVCRRHLSLCGFNFFIYILLVKRTNMKDFVIYDLCWQNELQCNFFSINIFFQILHLKNFKIKHGLLKFVKLSPASNKLVLFTAVSL